MTFALNLKFAGRWAATRGRGIQYACKEKDCHNRFTDSISLDFHKKSHLASEGQLEDDDKRNILAKFFGEQSLNLDQSCPKDKYFQAQGPDPSLEKKYSKCSGCGYMVLESHSCRLLQPNQKIKNQIYLNSKI